VDHPQTHVLHLSKNVHREGFDENEFLKWIQQKKFNGMIVDRPQNYPNIFKYLTELEKRGILHRQDEYRNAHYFTLK
jgi:hypothetical protein